MKVCLLICVCCFTIKSYSQRDFHWVFGDSVEINFNTNPPTVDTNRIIGSHEASASISDILGNLLFYVGSVDRDHLGNGCKKFVVRSLNDSIMPGGDSLAGHCSITQGLIILPDPGDTNKYYIFHIDYQGGGNPTRLFYSQVDMNLNNGLGAVTQSNIFITDSVSEKMHAVKAGNGRDWWLVITRHFPNLSFWKYKIDSLGVNAFSTQAMFIQPSVGQMIFSRQGEKLLFAGGTGISLLFDFDRCTGEVSNQQTLHTWTSAGKSRYGCSFSPSGRYAYISSFDSLWQFDTQAANVAASKQLISAIYPTQIAFQYGFAQHKLAPDGKIYIASTFDETNTNLNDSLKTYLTVIHSPDSGGQACSIAPYSFSLNGRHSYLTLPNMPNFNLGPLENINCDSILAVHENNENSLLVYPNPGDGRFTVHLRESGTHIIEVFNLIGKTYFKEEYNQASIPYKLDLSSLSDGIYIMKITDAQQNYGSAKVVIAR